MYTIVQAARALGVEAGQLARWVALGRIADAVRIPTEAGAVWRVPRDTVDRVAVQLRRSRTPTPLSTPGVAPDPSPRPSPPARSDPSLPWRRVEQVVARERAHWQRLSELQADTIAGLRRELDDAHRELRHLRERLAEHDEGRGADALVGRSTLRLRPIELAATPFPELEMAG